jgi:hypothetical protein
MITVWACESSTTLISERILPVPLVEQEPRDFSKQVHGVHRWYKLGLHAIKNRPFASTSGYYSREHLGLPPSKLV